MLLELRLRARAILVDDGPDGVRLADVVDGRVVLEKNGDEDVQGSDIRRGALRRPALARWSQRVMRLRP